ncbi:hypothetical protein DINM_006253 [Dirofilaria immitis]|nr:hypothetical protein [Dirofilaria immitis]
MFKSTENQLTQIRFTHHLRPKRERLRNRQILKYPDLSSSNERFSRLMTYLMSQCVQHTRRSDAVDATGDSVACKGLLLYCGCASNHDCYYFVAIVICAIFAFNDAYKESSRRTFQSIWQCFVQVWRTFSMKLYCVLDISRHIFWISHMQSCHNLNAVDRHAVVSLNEQTTDNGRALQWTNGLGSSNAFITLVSGPTPNPTSGTESGNVSTNVWHSNDAGDVNFADQSNTQQLLASTEKVQRNYGNADDSAANAHSEHATVTAMSFSDHIYSPSNLITTTSESSVKPELDVVVVGGSAKSPSAVEDRAAKTRSELLIEITWTDDLREILIQEMKKRPCLWDHNHPKYRDLQYAASERNEVIESFYHRTGFALNADDIARQWKSLRDQYVRFINKIRNMEPNDCRFPSFKFSEELKFLMPYKQLPQSRYCIMMNEENGLQNLNENIPSKESCSEFSVPGTSTTRLSIADYIRGIAKLDEKAAVWIRGEIWTLLTKCRMKALEGCSGNGTTRTNSEIFISFRCWVRLEGDCVDILLAMQTGQRYVFFAVIYLSDQNVDIISKHDHAKTATK